MILLPFESTFCLLILTKQSNTVDLRGMENGLSLIPSQDYIFCLKPVMVTMKKNNNSKLCTSIRSYPAVEPKKGCKSEGSQQYSVCDNAI